MRQLVYTMFTSNNRASFRLWWKKNLVKHQKVSEYYENDCRFLCFCVRHKFQNLSCHHRPCWIKEVTLLCNFWARNLAPIFHLVQNISEKYYPCLYLSIDQVWRVNELWFKKYSKMNPVWCTNTHHDVKDLVNHGMVKKIKAWNKKILTCASGGTFWEVIAL